jgi:putative redox protein
MFASNFKPNKLILSKMDKSKHLEVFLNLLDNKVHFAGSTEGQAPISIDYVQPVGEDMGYTSLELLLLSLGSCMATALVTFLRRSGKTVNSLNVKAEADRQAEHPTILTAIHLRFYFKSPDLKVSDVEKNLKITEEMYCPVYAMINSGIKIVSTCHISE